MIQSIRGFRDVLPDEGRRWRLVEDVLRRVLSSYAYEEVQLPLLESTAIIRTRHTIDSMLSGKLGTSCHQKRKPPTHGDIGGLRAPGFLQTKKVFQM